MKNICPCCNEAKTLLIRVAAIDEHQEKSFEVYELTSALVIKNHMLPHGIKLENQEPELICNACGQSDKASLALDRIKEVIKEKNPSFFLPTH